MGTTKYYVGIDVSKKKLDVCLLYSVEGSAAPVMKSFEVPNNADGFKEMVSVCKKETHRKFRPDNAMFCCETTGSYDHLLCYYLSGNGYFIWRENALQIKLRCGVQRGKDDKIDAVRIAGYACRFQDLSTPYERPSQVMEDLTALLQMRAACVEDLKRVKTRKKSTEDTYDPEKSMKKFILEKDDKVIERLNEVVKECDDKIKELVESESEIHKNYEHLITIPGIGKVNAVAFTVITNNFKDFMKASQICTYAGVAPFREKSGTSIDKKVRVGHLSNRKLKAYISMAACAALTYNPQMRAYADRLREKGKPNAIILNNIRNKLIKIMFALVKNDCDYDPEFMEKYQKPAKVA